MAVTEDPMTQSADCFSAQHVAALRNVLSVMSESRSNEQPVFDAILKNACALCNAPLAGLILGSPQDKAQKLAAHRGMFDRAIELFETGQMKMDPDLSYAARSIIEGRLIAFENMGESTLYQKGSPVVRSMVDESGIRSVLFVPLLKDGRAIGNLTLFRREVNAFLPAEIDLVQAFAEQAVIAIENVRQFREVQTRLEREAASKEILSVISRSRDDETPVFRAILDRAERLCNAQGSGLQLVNDARTQLLMMDSKGDDHGSFPVGFEFDLSEPLAMCAAVNEARVVQIEDLKDTDLYRAGHPGRVALVDVEGVRTHLHVPLLKDGVAFGNITLSRKEVRPFSSDEIALVETFAAQAVIAIENVRQFREVQTRLERETASRNILEVISQSREDEGPVFQEILAQAATLCRAGMAGLALPNEDRTHVFVAALHGTFKVFKPIETGFPIEADVGVAQSIREGRVIHRRSLQDIPEGQNRQAMADEGIKTMLWVPLMKDDIAIGSIGLFRLKEEAFSDDEIALVKMFCSQATIAIENARQFRDLETLNAELGTRVEEQVGEIERMGKLKRFLPAAVADTVVSSGSEDMLKSHRALLGVLFCDIRGFTAFCETAEPEETIEVLQTYHEEMGKLINAHGAGVDHRMGDGIMVLFNDPVPCDDPAGDAVRLALAMQARMVELCKGWKRLGHRLGFGVGVSLGYATVGMVGYEGRSDYTASGTAVNLAARLCDQAEDREILLSARAAIAVEEDYAVEAAGELSLKGIREPVEVFRLKPAT